MFKNVFQKCAVPVLWVIAGVLVGRLLIPKDSQKSSDGTQRTELHEKESGYTYINPLLECSSIESISNKQVVDIKWVFEQYINKTLVDKRANHTSVYFRDLNNGPWFGFGEKETFIPGSLLKVPFMIALYKIAEHDPSFLSREIEYEGGHVDFSEYFKPDKVIEPGATYTVDELIRRMIVYSDNDATLLLTKLVPTEIIEQVYTDLGILPPKEGDYSMTVLTYASFFRILFNGTYLNKTFSEKALELLDQSTFAKGIASGVPHTLPVAAKFGERGQRKGQDKQLHDCGIVYYPDRPYILCVMTRGPDFDVLSDTIAKISSLVYEEMSKGGGL